MSSSAPLAVGLNLVYLVQESGGAGRYARELIRSLLAVEPETRIVGFVGSTVPPEVFETDWGGRVEWVRFPVPGSGWPWHLLAQMGAIPAIALKRRLDVVHGLANVVPLVSPGVPTVATLLDVTWIHFPTTMERRATVAMKVLAPLCARSADRVIAISDAAKEDIVATIGLDARKIDVTPLGIRMEETVSPLPEQELRTRLAIPAGPLILSVAQKREHKNLASLIRAVPLLPRTDVQLVLPGTPTPHEQELRALAVELGIGDRVHFPAWVSEPELEGLYAAAACFVLPSLMEGFGLPILEAMRRGVPVACSNVSSLPEVAGDAALLFDPHRPDQIAAAVGQLIDDAALAGSLVERGLERCRAFTWERTASATLSVYRRAIEDRKAGGIIRRRVRARMFGAFRTRSGPS